MFDFFGPSIIFHFYFWSESEYVRSLEKNKLVEINCNWKSLNLLLFGIERNGLENEEISILVSIFLHCFPFLSVVACSSIDCFNIFDRHLIDTTLRFYWMLLNALLILLVILIKNLRCCGHWNCRVLSGTCTSAFKLKKLKEEGFNIYLFDANEPEWVFYASLV